MGFARTTAPRASETPCLARLAASLASSNSTFITLYTANPYTYQAPSADDHQIIGPQGRHSARLRRPWPVILLRADALRGIVCDLDTKQDALRSLGEEGLVP